MNVITNTNQKEIPNVGLVIVHTIAGVNMKVSAFESWVEAIFENKCKKFSVIFQSDFF